MLMIWKLCGEMNETGEEQLSYISNLSLISCDHRTHRLRNCMLAVSHTKVVLGMVFVTMNMLHEEDERITLSRCRSLAFDWSVW